MCSFQLLLSATLSRPWLLAVPGRLASLPSLNVTQDPSLNMLQADILLPVSMAKQVASALLWGLQL